MEFLKEFSMGLHYLRFNVRGSAALRVAFSMQVIGMMLNNSAFVAGWLIFVNVFGAINGWGALEIVALNGYNALIFGIGFVFCGGANEVRHRILDGGFDSVLLTPRWLMTRVLTLDLRTSAVGDIAFGFVCLGVYYAFADVPLVSIVMLASLVIPCTVLFVSWLLVASTVAFYIPDSDDLSRGVFEVFFSPSMFPAGTYQGLTRIILVFGIPSITLAALPIELIANFTWLWYVVVWVVSFAWAWIAYALFMHGVKRYESGNLTGAR